MEKKNTNKKLKADERGFVGTWLAKLLFTLISVKVWGLAASLIVSTWLLLLHNQGVKAGYDDIGISGGEWLTFNTTIWALIFGMKEVFRIMERKDSDEKEMIESKNETQKVIASIKAETPDLKTRSVYTTEGMEIVGEESAEA
ncbi:MAG: hypothetical protein K9G67_13495 [Bacteroidales bacterium]|nr:hypothetical protein [Bacteroidales bacterium]MCF8343705.1 hypothetical protein [Bacteroidales bacterium]MCF8352346.1 hypothetical protein [Bacteroidales bacterium]MCF8377366.1 hypothetical protein [Bacteroidales bacterium]MCF8401373.1 hypothetical protein [Bacteroidales bacterium]